jgi:hypothetical protein
MPAFKLVQRAVVFAFLILGFGFVPLFAEPSQDVPAASAPAATESWVLNAGGAVDFPIDNWNAAYRIGIGSRGEVSFPISSNWTAGLAFGYFHYQGNDATGPVIIDEIRVLPTLRLYLSDANLNPYLDGGAGVAAQFAAASGTITPHLNPDGFLGLGFELRLAPHEAIFFENNYSLMFAGRVQQDEEAILGLRCGF